MDHGAGARRMHGPGSPTTPVSRAGPVQVVPQGGGVPALPKPPALAFGVAEEAGVDRRCLRDVITAPLLTRNGRTFVRHRTAPHRAGRVRQPCAVVQRRAPRPAARGCDPPGEGADRIPARRRARARRPGRTGSLTDGRHRLDVGVSTPAPIVAIGGFQLPAKIGRSRPGRVR